MGAQNEVYGVLALEGGGLAGGADAAGESELLDAAFALEAAEFSEVAADAVDGVLAHVAGVEDHEVCLFVGVNLGVSGVEDHAPHPVRVVDVHLAAEGADAGGRWLPRRGVTGAQARCGALRDVDRGRDPRPLRCLTHSLPPARRRWLSGRSPRGGS